MDEQQYMRRAIALARLGEGWCHPNPLVGAVIVKNGSIIGEGYHERYGEPHAERNALGNLSESAEGATIYVTLEPCCHHGKQPPCTEAIISHGIGKVVIGSRDPNPLVAGKGVSILRSHGIEVVEDFLREECDELNPVFFHYITEKTPYVKMKYAMTMDGKIATKTGESKWITGEPARERVHKMRHASMGIMAGIGTVLTDDPLLNCRIPNGKSPVRIICDSNLRIPMSSQIINTVKQYRTILVCAQKEMAYGDVKDTKYSSLKDSTYGDVQDIKYDSQNGYMQNDKALSDKKNLQEPSVDQLYSKIRELINTGVEIINCPAEGDGNRVDLKKLMMLLGEKGIDSILLEGGATLNEEALKTGIVNEINVFMAPKIFGGNAKSPVGGEGVMHPDEAYRFILKNIEHTGEDVLLRYIRDDVRQVPCRL
ncbi:bifunctional diaminohydroxyphosphoribosylaminopyrimidine deaminase/5-amino-6-(5-phosphoribosylamino)uracil reductase RibD [Oribacterium sp. WCC10]|uniref:bifunctional diaminohydroxyphosphoribosylaminopyrimidine deaminase/5-amino-6-(5-phosphoribosylamino)uracil reductase RibD n=1 Tax=Oribacterium sp. WCC10 TaxID=1855343 RepID=UPI0008EB24B1|nr:bifunctional diaminohydroxyphosphoribosylaminopyrimidine deaminase/5-amino-6-(5-phosphoribosylamino)uracil reductase RibD [Oribacterium sp. WCC10]SFG19797.1 diaminohydroxyphosphoribosylaminopyrimidine deaminase [Oribacterium sp. WCC10]